MIVLLLLLWWWFCEYYYSNNEWNGFVENDDVRKMNIRTTKFHVPNTSKNPKFNLAGDDSIGFLILVVAETSTVNRGGEHFNLATCREEYTEAHR